MLCDLAPLREPFFPNARRLTTMTTHLSARIVWHDRAWDGCICDHPSKNAYCVVQPHIRDGRVDEREDSCAGQLFSELDG